VPAPDPVPAKPRLSHRLEYAGVLGVGTAFNVVPERFRTLLLESLGGLYQAATLADYTQGAQMSKLEEHRQRVLRPSDKCGFSKP